jgi:glycerate-2-kinase
MNPKELAERIFRSGVSAVHPGYLINKYLSANDNYLYAGTERIDLSQINNIYITGAGKATASMALSVENLLGPRISGGHISVKYGFSVPLKYIEITEAAHPVPDKNGFLATEKIVGIAKSAGSNDLIICLISGGGSALLPDCPEGISQSDLSELNNLLVKSGADIYEINIVRKHVSDVKGGRLAAAVYPARLISLIISDVPGDSPGSIASGPTCPDSSTYSDAIEIIKRYRLRDKIPTTVMNFLNRGFSGLISESPKPGDAVFDRVSNYIIGTNKSAIYGCKAECEALGINSLVLENILTGNVEDSAKNIVYHLLDLKNNASVKKPLAIITGGETTIEVTGEGIGGRNQHLALYCATLIEKYDGITLLTAGTDGNDGPTDAAGAVVDSDTIKNALLKGIDPHSYLKSFDSYNYFKKAGGHIITGPTMTNVMDIMVVLISQ